MIAAFLAETRGTATRITCPRMTTPGARLIKKQAVLHGGLHHLVSLSDAILTRDNHLAAGGAIRLVLQAAKARAPYDACEDQERPPGPVFWTEAVRTWSCWTTGTSLPRPAPWLCVLKASRNMRLSRRRGGCDGSGLHLRPRADPVGCGGGSGSGLRRSGGTCLIAALAAQGCPAGGSGWN